MKFSLKINIIVSDKRWNKLAFDLNGVTMKLANLALMEIDAYPDSDKFEFSVNLMDDAQIQILNRDFRNKDKPTNVLSFPSEESPYIGDVAISYDTIFAEAEEYGKDFKNHYAHMIVHAILHLMGYDHEADPACRFHRCHPFRSARLRRRPRRHRR